MNRFKRKIVFLFLMIFSTGFIFADDSFINSFVTKTWNSADGLPGNTITDIIQTKDGYIYIGSYEGLVRFDGIQFTIENKNTNSKYSFISARSIFQDSNENIWIGSNDEGVTCKRKDGTTLLFNMDNGLPNNSVRAFAEDGKGNIWIGTSSGLAVVSNGSILIPDGITFLPKGNTYMISSLFADHKGNIWITTSDTGECFCYKNDSFFVHGGFRSLKENSITTVYEDSNGAMWFGVAPYYVVRILNNEEKIYNVGFGHQKATIVSHIYEDKDNNIWCSMDNGIAVISDEKIDFLSMENGLADDKVTKIIQDFEGNIWLGTDRAGIEKLTKAKFYTIPLKTTINAIAEDKFRNCIWFATDNGIICYQNNMTVTNSITEYCKNIRIRHVSLESNGSLLVSSYAKLGQVEFALDGSVRSWTKDNGLTGNKVRVAMEASNGNIYIGTTTGLSIVTEKEIVEITKNAQITNDYIMCLYEDKNGDIWCGTDGGGIFVLRDGNYVRSYSTADNLAGNVVFKIESIVENEIWISTGSGISVFKDGKFHNFDSSNGMGTDSVFQAINDKKGKIWFTSNRGIFSVKLNDFEAVIDGQKDTVDSNYYGATDGILSGGVTSTSLSTIDDNGDIWFTMIDGVVKFDSKIALSKNAKPLVHIEEIMVDSKKVPFDGKPIVLLPQDKRISIKFLGLYYSAPEKLKFKTKLEGFDADYSDWTTERTVSYTNLEPKQYKFSLLVMNNEEIIGELTENLIIIQTEKPVESILPQIFIFILIFIGIVIIVAFIIKHRIHILKKQQEKLESIVNERTAELVSLQHSLEKQVEDRTAELRSEKEKMSRVSVEVTMALAGTIDAKDTYTKGHSNRVADYSRMLAARMGKSQEYQNQIYYIAILHDIGKIGIPDSIINKPGKLTDEEYALIKKHPEIGSDILKSITSLPEVSVGARWHHERYDGKGYPDGLSGEKIPEIARIIGVADSYDAMSSNRSYRKYMPQSAIREEIIKCRGTQFDPVIADLMVELIDEDKDYKMHE